MRIYSLLLILVLLSSCGQDDCHVPGGYMFERPATLSPAKLIYNVGDTITVSAMFSDEVYDRATGRTYLLENFDFYPLSTFCRLDTVGIDTLELVTEEHFDFIISPTYNYNLRISNSAGAELAGEFNYEDHVYDLEYKIVVKKPGLYLSTFSTWLDNFSERIDFPGQCKGQILDSWTMLNDGAANNDTLLLDAVDEGWHRHYNEPNLNENFHRWGGYCFKVE